MFRNQFVEVDNDGAIMMFKDAGELGDGTPAGPRMLKRLCHEEFPLGFGHCEPTLMRKVATTPNKFLGMLT